VFLLDYGVLIDEFDLGVMLMTQCWPPEVYDGTWHAVWTLFQNLTITVALFIPGYGFLL
jgi:hypothetical protein